MVSKIGQVALGAMVGLSIFFLLAWAYFVMSTIPFGALVVVILFVFGSLMRLSRRVG